MKKQLKKLMQEYKSLHPNNPKQYQIWSQIGQLCSKEIDKSIEFFKQCDHEELDWYSDTFEDILENCSKKDKIKFKNFIKNSHYSK